MLYEKLYIVSSGENSEEETVEAQTPHTKAKAKISKLLMVNDSNDITDSEAIDSLSLEEAIIDLYLTIKIRKEEDDVDDNTIKNEKEHLREVDSFVVLEYIRNSFEILVNMKEESKESRKENNANVQTARTAIDTQICSEPEGNDYE